MTDSLFRKSVEQPRNNIFLSRLISGNTFVCLIHITIFLLSYKINVGDTCQQQNHDFLWLSIQVVKCIYKIE